MGAARGHEGDSGEGGGGRGGSGYVSGGVAWDQEHPICSGRAQQCALCPCPARPCMCVRPCMRVRPCMCVRACMYMRAAHLHFRVDQPIDEEHRVLCNRVDVFVSSVLIEILSIRIAKQLRLRSRKPKRPVSGGREVQLKSTRQRALWKSSFISWTKKRCTT